MNSGRYINLYSNIKLDTLLDFVIAYNDQVRTKPSINVVGADKLDMCAVCGNRSVIVESKQVRASDEEATEVKWCYICTRKD